MSGRAKHPGGRPPKLPSGRLGAQITVRLPESDMAALEAEAEARTLANVRLVGLGNAERVGPADVLRDVVGRWAKRRG